MNVRITSGPAKVGYVVLASIVVMVVGIIIAIAGFTITAQFATLGLGILALVFAVRTFRGPSESLSSPRAWWRMTERPTSGYVAAAYFAIQAVAYLAVPAAPGAGLLACVVSAVIALAFLHSSWRLAKREEGPPA